MANSRAVSITDRELWACAQKMIDMHRTDAELQAAMRADELLEAGDFDGQRVWMAILKRIEQWRSGHVPPLLQ